MQRYSKDLILLIVGSFIFAIGINYFAIPNQLSEGGIIGITIVTYYLFGWSPGITNFLINTSLVAIGYKYFTKRMTILTIISIVITSIFLHITAGWGESLNGDTLLAALYAGLAVGMGIGFIFKAGGTSGGTTILARLLNQWLGWSVGSAMLIIDITVIAGSSFVIGKEKAMYTLIAVYIGAKVIDAIVEGTEERSAVMIISDKSENILQAVTEKMSQGVTVLEAKGGYSQTDKNVLYIVINKREIVQLKKLVEAIDPEAYITLHRVQEIFRKGYKGEKRSRIK
ncbi:YitT family protein [Thalassobacillus devorans]|uniref:YitT family protein n=1 Tax=Thalassobacillus devorans TaxID=279813 RepID=UPI00048F9A99|nr:YitT family protein [Thalassobacillus devorans]